MRFATAVLALTALMGIAGSVPPQAWGHTDALRIETFTLDNGLQVIALPMPRSPKVTYMVWYKVGAADDPVGKSGLAHLVEHATFRGVGAHVEQDTARSGAHRSTSEANAFTSTVGRLQRHLVVEKRLATAVGVDYLPDSVDVTDFTVHAMPAPGVEVVVLEQAIDRELEAIMAKGVSGTEVLRAQRHLQHQTPVAHGHGHPGAETLGIALATGRTLAEMSQWQERIAWVTQEQVQATAQAVLRAERSVTGVLLPASANEAARAKGLQIEPRGGAGRVHTTMDGRWCGG